MESCSKDPIGYFSGELSVYLYVGGNSLSLRDPQGLARYEDAAGRSCDSNETCIVGICAYCASQSVGAQVLQNIAQGNDPGDGIDTGHTAVCWNCRSNYPGPRLPKRPPFETVNPNSPRRPLNNACTGLYPRGGGFNGGQTGIMHPDWVDFRDKWDNGELSCANWSVCPETLVKVIAPVFEPLPEYDVLPKNDGPLGSGCENCTTFACKQLCEAGIDFPILVEPFNVCRHPLCETKGPLGPGWPF